MTAGDTSFNPTAFGSRALWGQAGAVGIDTIGTYFLTRRANQMADIQANIARTNAQQMEAQAQGALRAGEKAVLQKTMQAGQVKGSQRAALAANGIAIGEGSAAEQLASTDIIKEIDANQLAANAMQQAWGYRNKALDYEGEARMMAAQKRSPWGMAGLTLMGGARAVMNNYLKLSDAGAFNQKQKAAPIYSGYTGQRLWGDS